MSESYTSEDSKRDIAIMQENLDVQIMKTVDANPLKQGEEPKWFHVLAMLRGLPKAKDGDK